MTQIARDAVYLPSGEVVAREIEGEIIIVPLTAGIGDLYDDLFSLNETGRAVWERLDGTRTVRQIITELAAEFAEAEDAIAAPVCAFLEELLRRRMLEERSGVPAP